MHRYFWAKCYIYTEGLPRSVTLLRMDLPQEQRISLPAVGNAVPPTSVVETVENGIGYNDEITSRERRTRKACASRPMGLLAHSRPIMTTTQEYDRIKSARLRLRRVLAKMQPIAPEQSVLDVVDSWDSALAKAGWSAEPRTARHLGLVIQFMQVCPQNDVVLILQHAVADWTALRKHLEHYYGCWGLPAKPTLDTIVPQAGGVITWAMKTKDYVPPNWPPNDWPM